MTSLELVSPGAVPDDGVTLKWHDEPKYMLTSSFALTFPIFTANKFQIISHFSLRAKVTTFWLLLTLNYVCSTMSFLSFRHCFDTTFSNWYHPACGIVWVRSALPAPL